MMRHTKDDGKNAGTLSTKVMHSINYVARPAFRTAQSSSIAIGRYSWQATKAVPTFIGQCMSNRQGPPIFSQSLRLFWTDILPMIAVHTLYRVLASFNQDNELGFFSYTCMQMLGSIALSVAWMAMTLIVFRQKLRFLAHSFVLMIAYPKAFERMTLKDRTIDAAICKDCSKARFLKGEIRTVLVYLAQLITLGALRRVCYVGWLMAMFSQIKLNGELVSEYRLSNDGVCDRHRAEFFHENVELSLAFGLMHLAVVRLLTGSIALATGLMSFDLASLTGLLTGYDSYDYEAAIGAIVMLYFIGLAHHVDFPRPIKKALRHCYDPLTITRVIMGALIDLLTPGFKKIFDGGVASGKIKMSWRHIRSRLLWAKNNNKVQKLAYILLPALVRDHRELMVDPIVKLYYPEVFKQITAMITMILRMKSTVLCLADLKLGYDTYLAPIEGYINVVTRLLSSFFVPIKIIGTTIGFIGDVKLAGAFTVRKNNRASKLIEFFSSMPKGLVLIYIGMMRDVALVQDIEKLRIYMQKILKDYQAALNALEFVPVEAVQETNEDGFEYLDYETNKFFRELNLNEEEKNYDTCKNDSPPSVTGNVGKNPRGDFNEAWDDAGRRVVNSVTREPGTPKVAARTSKSDDEQSENDEWVDEESENHFEELLVGSGHRFVPAVRQEKLTSQQLGATDSSQHFRQC